MFPLPPQQRRQAPPRRVCRFRRRRSRSHKWPRARPRARLRRLRPRRRQLCPLSPLRLRRIRCKVRASLFAPTLFSPLRCHHLLRIHRTDCRNRLAGAATGVSAAVPPAETPPVPPPQTAAAPTSLRPRGSAPASTTPASQAGGALPSATSALLARARVPRGLVSNFMPRHSNVHSQLGFFILRA